MRRDTLHIAKKFIPYQNLRWLRMPQLHPQTRHTRTRQNGQRLSSNSYILMHLFIKLILCAFEANHAPYFTDTHLFGQNKSCVPPMHFQSL